MLNLIQTSTTIKRLEDVVPGDKVLDNGIFKLVQQRPVYGPCTRFTFPSGITATVQRTGDMYATVGNQISYSENYNASYFYRGFMKARNKKADLLFFPPNFVSSLLRSYVAAFDELPQIACMPRGRFGMQVHYRAAPDTPFAVGDLSRRSLTAYLQGWAINGVSTRGDSVLAVGYMDAEVALVFRMLNIHLMQFNREFYFPLYSQKLLLYCLNSRYDYKFRIKDLKRIAKQDLILPYQKRWATEIKRKNCMDWYLPEFTPDINTLHLQPKIKGGIWEK